MENNYLLIILLVIIVVFAAAVGFALMNPTVAKEPSKIKITSDKEQYEGGELSLQLTDLNKTPLTKEIVNITVTDSKGKVVVDDVLKTDSKGKAKIDLELKKGKYDVNVTYEGNENFTGNSTEQKLTIKEEVVEEVVVEQSNPSNELHYDEEINVYYDGNGKVVDPDGRHGQSVGSSYSDLRDSYEKWQRGELEM